MSELPSLADCQKLISDQYWRAFTRVLLNQKKPAEIDQNGILSPVRLPFRHTGKSLPAFVTDSGGLNTYNPKA